jgi:hypothetical protein
MKDEDKEKLKNTTNELIQKYSIKNLSFLNIQGVNHRPHILVVGPKTMKWASKHGGIISDDAPCDYPGCELTFKEHKCDTVMFLELTGIADKKKSELMLKELAPIVEKAGVDGFSFVQKDKSCTFA